jgi:predicted dinucleotide-binding enzyme
MTRVGVLGSGSVGKTLAAGFKKHGYDARIASRTPSKLADFSKSSGVETGTFADVAAWADVLVLAVQGTAAEDAVHEAGVANVKGKIILDTTNPVAPEPAEDGVIRVFTGPNSSLMERLQASFPDAKFVKVFNSVGHQRMVDPVYDGGTPTMFYCGNDASAKKMAERIIREFGWEPADMGTAKAARAIEPLCQLWCITGFLENSWTHAFRLLR